MNTYSEKSISCSPLQWREAALELRKQAIKFEKIAQDLENKELKKI